jgi:hypothetical protein
MRRLLGPLLIVALGLSAPAHAGLFSALKGVTKLSKMASSAGKVTKAAKGASLLKGAGQLSAVVAAERVFAHTASSASRVPLYVTRADDGLKVVLSSGDELVHSPASLQRFTAELDEMATIADDAGVDLFVDASVASELAGLPVGPNTRVWLANVDGPSLPLRATADGAAEVGLGHDLWVRLGTDLAQVAVQIANAPVAAEVTVAGPCGTDPAEAIDQQLPGDTLVVLDDLDPSGRDAWVDYAAEHGLDLVVVGLADVCSDAALPVRAAAERAATTADLWALAQAEGPPVLEHTGSRLQVQRGDVLLAVHLTALRDEYVAPEEEDPYAPLKGFAVLCVAGLGWLAYTRLRRRDDQ